MVKMAWDFLFCAIFMFFRMILLLLGFIFGEF
jgi:hypothetical protein